jgi:hypothetical protein
MKALPKLMKGCILAIRIVSKEMPEFEIRIEGAKSWPNIARLDTQTKTLRFFDTDGNIVHETVGLFGSTPPPFMEFLNNFGLTFIGVTESSVDFESKTQFISAKMRAVNLDSHEALHGDNWGYDE